MPASRSTVGSRVYLVGAEPVQMVKIGRAKDVGKRLVALRVSSPVPLELLGDIPGGPAVEFYLHEVFAPHRSHGEWFREDSTMRAVVADEAELPSPTLQMVEHYGGAEHAERFRTFARIEQALALRHDTPARIAFHLDVEEDAITDDLRAMAAMGFLRGSDTAVPSREQLYRMMRDEQEIIEEHERFMAEPIYI